MKKIIIATIILGSLGGNTWAREGVNLKDPWKERPGVQMRHLFRNGGQLVSSTALSLPGGGSAVINYIKTNKEMFRCIDWYTGDFQSTGFMCYDLDLL